MVYLTLQDRESEVSWSKRFAWWYQARTFLLLQDYLPIDKEEIYWRHLYKDCNILVRIRKGFKNG